MKIYFKTLWDTLKTAFRSWWAKDPFRESAVIAYYAIFSLPGLMVVVVSIAGYFFGHDVVNQHLATQIAGTLGSSTAEQIQDMIAKTSALGNSFWAIVLGIATILVGATGVFAQFQKSLNTIWEVKAAPSKSGIWKVIKVRLFSFGILLSIAFILIVSLVISSGLSAFGNWLSTNFSASFQFLLQAINFLLSLCITALLFAAMFRFLPDVKVEWRHVWIGAFLTAFLFEIAKFALGLYFGKASPGKGYGTAGSVILILLWVSYSSMIVFYGAEFIRAYANRLSGKVKPTEIATRAITVVKKK